MMQSEDFDSYVEIKTSQLSDEMFSFQLNEIISFNKGLNWKELSYFYG